MENETLEYPDGLPLLRRIISVISISLGIALAVLDVSIVNVALPSLAKIFNVSSANSIWLVNCYQLVIVMLLLAASTLGEIFGYKKLFMFGLAIFSSASFLCAIAKNFDFLVIARLLQGIGASFIMSINMTLLRLTYPKKYLGGGIGFNSTLVALFAVIGPSFAGFVLSYSSWEWLFMINVPIGLLAFLLGAKSLPDNQPNVNGRKFPTYDAFLNAIFFFTFIYAFESISHEGSIYVAICPLVVSVIIGFYFVRRQLKIDYPLLPLDLMRIPSFAVSTITKILSFTVQTLAYLVLPFYFTSVHKMSPSEVGMLMSAWPIAIIISAPLAGFLIGKIHPDILGSVGLILMASGIGLVAILPDNASSADMVWRLFVCGFGFGLFQSPNNNTLMISSPVSRSGSASGMLSLARLLGQVIGATMVALFLTLFGDDKGHYVTLGVAFFIALSTSFITISSFFMIKKK